MDSQKTPKDAVAVKLRAVPSQSCIPNKAKKSALMKSLFKRKDSTDTVDTPPSTKASLGSSAWRRRVGESARNKLGLSRHETDDHTGDLDAGVAAYRAAVLKLKEAQGALEYAEASEKKSDARRKDALKALGGDDDLIEAALAAEERTDRFDRVEGWCLAPLRSVRRYESVVESAISSRDSILQEYFARKRKLETAQKKKDDVVSRQQQYDDSCQRMRAATARLEPLLDAFVSAAQTALSECLRCAAAARIVQLEDAAARLRPWAAATISGEAASVARDLLRGVAASRRDGTTISLEAPASGDLQRLEALVAQAPAVVAPAPATPQSSDIVPEVGPTEAASLAALLQRLGQDDALTRKGLFRIPGDAATCASMKERLDAGDAGVVGTLDVDDCATLAKGWFRDRPGLVPKGANLELRAAADVCGDDDEAFAAGARDVLSQGGAAGTVVRDLLVLLHAVSQRQAENAMTPENLAICWAPNVFVIDPDSPASVADLQPAIRLTARLVAIGDRLRG